MGEVHYKYLAKSGAEYKELEDHITTFKRHIIITNGSKNSGPLTLIVEKTLAGVQMCPEGKYSTITEVEIYSKNDREKSEVTIENLFYKQRYLQFTLSGTCFIIDFNKERNG